MVIDDLEAFFSEEPTPEVTGGTAIAAGDVSLGYGYSFAGAYTAATGTVSYTYADTSASSFVGEIQAHSSAFIHAKAYGKSDFNSSSAVYHASAHFHNFSGSSMTIGGSTSSSYNRSWN